MKKLIPSLPSLLVRHCRHLAPLVRAAALLLGMGLALPAWSALTVNAGNGTVTDSTTGLVWDQCTYGTTTTTTACDTGTPTTFNWAAALRATVAANAAAYKGFRDWRLPNRNELESIVKIDSTQFIDTTAFPNTPIIEIWTSTNDGQDASKAWAFLRANNGVSYQRDKLNVYSARLVRSGQPLATFDSVAVAPDTPAAPTATSGNTAASVSFVPPADNGGAITGYTVVSNPAGGVDGNAGTTGLTHSITGLTNGTAYTFTVTATNNAGTSSASAASNSVTPNAVPGTPAAPTATAGNTTASVSFAAPADNGSAITGYTVVSSPAGGVDSNAGTTGLAHVMTSLTNGTAYTFTVTATNAAGTSGASTASNSVIPAAAPGTPAAPTATAGNSTASVSFAAPANNGSAITGYTVVSNPAGGVDSNAGSTGLTHSITGLTNGVAYTFTVTATNGVGTSSASSASNSVTPVGGPATPAAPTATAGNTSASVSFVAPANNGSPITGYTVVSNPAGGVDSNAGSTGLTHAITGLTNGTAYTFTVTATNGVGISGASVASNSVTPAAAPATPAAPTATAGNATASVSFTAPANNGSAITGYTVVSNPAGGVDSNAGSTGLTHAMTGLTNGTAYTFTVTATNAVGVSTASPASNSVTPAAAPSTPAAPTATAGNTTASVSFTAPANNGSAITGYTVVSAPAGGVDSNAGSTGLTHSITGLTNGTAYTFTVTATNAVGVSAASPASNSVTPAVPVVVPDTTPAIPVLPVTIPGVGPGSLPSILNMGAGDGPSFMGQLVSLLSREVGSALHLVEQNATGTVTLGGYNGGHLAFLPHSFQTGDFRTNGVYPMGNGQYQVVVNGQSITIAPALVRVDLLMALLTGVTASIADTGVITASLNGTTYVVQPGVAVQLNPPTGQSSLVLGADGTYRFADAQGNTQVVYPAFSAPALLRNVLQSIDPAATMSIELDATASIVLNGVRYTLVPDLTLGGVTVEQLGMRYWPDGDNRYRMWVNIGQSQGMTVKPQ